MNNQTPITQNYEIRFFAILATVLLFLFIISLIFNPKTQKRDTPILSESASQPFSAIAINAKAVYIYDIRTDTVLFAKNENSRLSLASLAKIMSSLVAEDLGPLSSIITISGEALQATGDGGLYRDEKWFLEDILDFSLLTSSNDGIRAVALTLGALSRVNASTEEIINDFVGEMNRKDSELGLKNTYYWNETGLDESATKGGAYGTAKDMSTLLEYVLINKPELMAATGEVKASFSSINNYLHVAKNTNGIANEIPGLIASKTGFTDTAGGNLVFIFDPELGRPIIVSILGSTEKGRFEDAQKLVKAIMEYISNS